MSVFQPAASSCVLHANQLVITIQPDEGFELSFEVKAPGQPLRLETQRLHFRYAEAFAPLPDGYETLLLDVLAGDRRCSCAPTRWRSPGECSRRSWSAARPSGPTMPGPGDPNPPTRSWPATGTGGSRCERRRAASPSLDIREIIRYTTIIQSA